MPLSWYVCIFCSYLKICIFIVLNIIFTRSRHMICLAFLKRCWNWVPDFEDYIHTSIKLETGFGKLGRSQDGLVWWCTPGKTWEDTRDLGSWGEKTTISKPASHKPTIQIIDQPGKQTEANISNHIKPEIFQTRLSLHFKTSSLDKHIHSPFSKFWVLLW